jgi:aspartate aminotransferase/aminotransferase
MDKQKLKNKTKASKIVTNVVEANSIRYNNMVYEMKQRGEDIIVLSLGEAFFNIPLFSFDDLPFPDIYHYSHSRGIIELRNNISKYFNDEYGFSFNPESEIIVTAGSKIAIHMSLMAILNPNDEVLIFEPCWVSYTEQVKLCYGKPITIQKNEIIFNIEKYITKKTKCIIINNPNNPTGKIYSKSEVEFLLNIAIKYDIYILSDEAYSDFIPDDVKFISLGKISSNLQNSIVCNSISKNYGISGWRLGYVITNSKLINEILKINQHLITCPATILEHYISKHFFEIIKITKPQIKKVVEQRKKVAEYMNNIGLSFMDGSAAWYFFVSIKPSQLSSNEFCTRLLLEYHISAVPGIGYGVSCDKDIRIAIGTESWERIVKGLLVIKNLIDKTS